MKKFGLWLRKWGWLIIAGVAAVLGAVFGLKFLRKSKPDDPPSFAEMAKDEAAVLETRIEIEKAKAKAETDAQRNQLDRIEEIPDDAKRRKKLAEFLEGL